MCDCFVVHIDNPTWIIPRLYVRIQPTSLVYKSRIVGYRCSSAFFINFAHTSTTCIQHYSYTVCMYSRFMHLCNRKSARTKTIVVVHLISHKQQFTQQDKVVFKAASLLQRCLNLL